MARLYNKSCVRNQTFEHSGNPEVDLAVPSVHNMGMLPLTVSISLT